MRGRGGAQRSVGVEEFVSGIESWRRMYVSGKYLLTVCLKSKIRV